MTGPMTPQPERPVLRELSLFTGCAGFTLGLRLAGVPIKTVGYVEIDEYCQRLIQARIRDGYLDWAPIIRDIRSADFRPMAGLVDIVTAGFPCQPHSFAGKRRGADDERNLWPETLRVIREVGAGWVLLENVPGILANGYAGTVVGELSEIGYDCLWHCVPAAAVGAPHLRWRWWCLAYSVSMRQLQPEGCQPDQRGWIGNGCEPMAYALNNGHHRPEGYEAEQGGDEPHNGLLVGNGSEVAHTEQPGLEGESQRPVRRLLATTGSWWAVEPDVGRVADGVASRVDRLKALGNGIVPLQLAYFIRKLSGMA